MQLIGDPHLGRVFRAYVPLDRRGDREEMMMKEFEKQINASDDMTVVVGDLFENPYVTLQTLWQTLTIILEAAAARPLRQIIIMAGNHDLDKAIERRGSFHLLAIALERVPNVKVLFEPTVIHRTVFFPWQYERTALEQLDGLDLNGVSIAIGHWDLDSFGNDHADHLCPARELQEKGITKIYSGHWHVAGTYTVDGVPVLCTGSMQPMTHSEDPRGELYVTLTKEEYERADPETFRNRYVRVRLAKGEEISPPNTCLGFKTDISDVSVEVERVNLGTFDMEDILKQAFTSFEVKPGVQSFIRKGLNDTH
jgi:DNA repair exonuclease SbcCD nuclease subunit